jgi:hypothetical protein
MAAKAGSSSFTPETVVITVADHKIVGRVPQASPFARRERPCHGRAAKQGDKVAPSHSITSSARC